MKKEEYKVIKDMVVVIEQDIKWHEEHFESKGDYTDKEARAFIKGLKQAVTLLSNMAIEAKENQ